MCPNGAWYVQCAQVEQELAADFLEGWCSKVAFPGDDEKVPLTGGLSMELDVLPDRLENARVELHIANECSNSGVSAFS